ncbi:restriction endonuclease subunit S [Pseudobacteriovorax antillogorgiicola]|uniref:Type I restriction enzyme, S subunit n=1 Tax=Pseudobacteriovorax antillogorgiicola TaxID=1513793 RepID=A0A1Y6CP05_9BACT|nr:restriction endonuclease subunit S [Pseudobacteriovorax antillogorgiicola]TCS44635.1 type I restriction enzyme S subunit [Pseudobacteriovorax antillogorgiicola]SMF78501.1 type I restriction enzyme, S subunit [Pseudobacteriovorax antillogorgiicola]
MRSNLNTVKVSTILERVQTKVDVEPDKLYREIGIRSHGKGIFHKEETSGKDIGNKRVFHIESDCLVLNIVFAWEQAVAKTTTNEVGMIASHRFPMYSPVQGKVDLDYLLYYFKSPIGKYKLGLASPGGAGRNKTLGQKEFNELELKLPTYPEQKKIAQILSTWDKAIAQLETLIELKEKRKRGLMRYRLDVGNGKGSMYRFEDIVSWTQLGTTSRGISSGGKAKKLVKMGNLNWGGLNLEKIEDIEGKEQELEAFCLKPGDLLFNTRNTPELVGKSAVWKLSCSQYVFDNNINRIRFKDGFRPEYICSLLSNGHGKARLKAIAVGSTSVAAIYWKDLKRLKMSIPQSSFQVKTVELFELLQNEIDEGKRLKSKIEMQKKALMQQLLTGKKRVKLDEVDHG